MSRTSLSQSEALTLAMAIVDTIRDVQGVQKSEDQIVQELAVRIIDMVENTYVVGCDCC